MRRFNYYRPKALIRPFKISKQIIHNDSAYLSNNQVLKLDFYNCFVNSDYVTTDTSGLIIELVIELASNGVITDNIKFTQSETVDSKIKIACTINNPSSLDEITINETKHQFKRVSNFVNDNLEIDFDNFGTPTTVQILSQL
jgi:hypothetical protein